MDDFWQRVMDVVREPRALGAVRGMVVLVGGLIFARLAAAAVAHALAARATPQQQMLARRLTSYTIIALVVAATLREFGFDLSVLVGAAGILTVAVGFASQTSASNIISGLFLIGEKPFEIGDFVRCGATEGEVMSIDLLSVRLRTFDNLLVRLPNETLLKSEITNLSRLPIRRFDLKFSVAYHSDLAAVRRIVLDVADADPRSLDEPAPWFVFEDFGDSGLLCRISVWAANERFYEWRNELRMALRTALENGGIEIPFPHVTLYAGSRTGALPIALTSSAPAPQPEPPADTEI